MHTLFGVPKLNLTSANKHVAEIERHIRVIKERIRAVLYSLPFHAIPQIMLTHAVLLAYSISYLQLTPDEQDKARIAAKERFLAYALMKTSSNSHKKFKADLSDDFTKGTNKYPETRQHTLLLLDKYTKKLTTITQSEDTAFAQKGSTAKKGSDKKSMK